MVISFEIYEASFGEFHRFHMKYDHEFKILFIICLF